MAKFDFNDKEDVKKLKNELNGILESKIQKLELDAALKSLSSQPFGAIRNVFEGITDKLYENAEGKKIIGRYVKAIREGKNVSDAYSVYEFVNRSPNVTNPQLFLSEALEMASGMDRKAFDSEKEKVANVVAEAVRYAGKDAEFVEENINRNFAMNEAIDYLMLNQKNFSNLPEYVNKFDYVREHLEENMEEKPLNEAVRTGKELIAAMNESLEGLESWERSAIVDIAMAKLAGKDPSIVFEERKNACIEKIDENLESEKSIDMKSHLESMRAQLSEKKYNEGSIYEDIITLSELESKLSE
jgi:hypothetical protein